MTPFALLCELAGLSHREAGEFLSVRLDTAKSWSAGRNPSPAGALDELKRLIGRQRQAAEAALAEIGRAANREGPPDMIEIGYPADDAEAQGLGWPCVGAWRAMAARIVAESPLPVRLVARGATPASAAAVDVHRF